MSVLLVLGLLAIICLAGCRKAVGPRRAADSGKKPAAPIAGKEPAEESALKAEFHGAKMTWDDETGARVWEARFKEAIVSQTGKGAVVELREVEASLYRGGRIASKLVAPRVVADSRSREVRAAGGVKITSALDDASARAERLVWKSRQDKLFGVGGVQMKKGNLSVTARSFEADTALKKARFTDAKMSLE
ncbi:MAG TPA: hypothetical protein VMX94_03225 [Armatimonadota bacterium]|nr:hypothetical protein [Armatimonadota bacterium]